MGASFGIIGNVSNDFCRPTTPPPPTPARFRFTSPQNQGSDHFGSQAPKPVWPDEIENLVRVPRSRWENVGHEKIR